MSSVLRDSQRSQDSAMFTLLLFGMPRQTRKLRKKTASDSNQMSGLSG